MWFVVTAPRTGWESLPPARSPSLLSFLVPSMPVLMFWYMLYSYATLVRQQHRETTHPLPSDFQNDLGWGGCNPPVLTFFPQERPWACPPGWARGALPVDKCSFSRVIDTWLLSYRVGVAPLGEKLRQSMSVICLIRGSLQSRCHLQAWYSH